MIKLKYFVTDNPSLGLPLPVLRTFNEHAMQAITILGEHWDCGCDGSDLGKRRNMSDNWTEGGVNFDDMAVWHRFCHIYKTTMMINTT